MKCIWNVLNAAMQNFSALDTVDLQWSALKCSIMPAENPPDSRLRSKDVRWKRNPMSQPAPRPVWPSSTWHFMAGAVGLASHRKGWLWPLRPPQVMASYAQHWMEWPPVISIAEVMAEADFPQMFRKQKLCLVVSHCNNKCSFTTLDFFGGAAVIIVYL